MTGFRVVDSTARCRAGFLEIDELTVEGPDGETFARHVVRHPGAVVMVPIDGDEVILIRQYRAAVDDALLEVPAGKRDVRGEAPATTAARELAEEIGFRPGRLEPIAEFYNSPGFCDEYTYLYCATELEALPDRAAVSAEERHLRVERVALDAVGGLIDAGRIVDAKSIIGLLLAGRHLGRRAG